ncbi:MAG: rRNA small subunit methyltransferase 1 [Alphaproteobacteria bacterium]|nr:rRNA small subunit methyltransferase 1 [Alphaproteobacteria bacterium]
MPSTPEASAPEPAGRAGAAPLQVVATPIGNLGDLSPRARDALASADLVLCEDTRSTRKLLSAIGLPTPELWRCDAWREAGQAGAVIDRLRQGRAVVLVSDAGTPGVSDPGGVVVEAVLAAGLPVVAVPGPSSLAAALSVAGLPAAPVHFLGFPPRKAGPRRRALVDASQLPGTLVWLESGRRVGDLVADLASLMPARQVALCLELSKLHERVERDRADALSTEPRLGEAVVVVGPGDPVAVDGPADPADGSLKAVAAALAERWGIPKRDAYQRLLALERELP